MDGEGKRIGEVAKCREYGSVVGPGSGVAVVVDKHQYCPAACRVVGGLLTCRRGYRIPGLGYLSGFRSDDLGLLGCNSSCARPKAPSDSMSE